MKDINAPDGPPADLFGVPADLASKAVDRRRISPAEWERIRNRLEENMKERPAD